MLKYKKNLTLSQGGPDIGLKVGILAEIGYMLHECAVWPYEIKIISKVSFNLASIKRFIFKS